MLWIKITQDEYAEVVAPPSDAPTVIRLYTGEDRRIGVAAPRSVSVTRSDATTKTPRHPEDFAKRYQVLDSEISGAIDAAGNVTSDADSKL